GEPDPEESYVVKIKGGYFENKSLLMEYTPTGILSKGEAESKDESLEFTLKAIKIATSIAGAVSGILPLGIGGGMHTLGAAETKQRDEQFETSKQCYQTSAAFADRAAVKAYDAKQKAWTSFLQADTAHRQEANERYAAAAERLQA